MIQKHINKTNPFLKICVAHLNAADLGPIQVRGCSMPVRLSFVAGAKAHAAGL